MCSFQASLLLTWSEAVLSAPIHTSRTTTRPSTSTVTLTLSPTAPCSSTLSPAESIVRFANLNGDTFTHLSSSPSSAMPENTGYTVTKAWPELPVESGAEALQFLLPGEVVDSGIPAAGTRRAHDRTDASTSWSAMQEKLRSLLDLVPRTSRAKKHVGTPFNGPNIHAVQLGLAAHSTQQLVCVVFEIVAGCPGYATALSPPAISLPICTLHVGGGGTVSRCHFDTLVPPVQPGASCER